MLNVLKYYYLKKKNFFHQPRENYSILHFSYLDFNVHQNILKWNDMLVSFRVNLFL